MTVTLPALADLRARLPELMLRDEQRLRRRLDDLERRRPPRPDTRERLAAEIDAAEQRMANRRAGVPRITYPAALPVSQRREDLLAAVRDHQVVVVAGETGSGKTTQLPKICLELGRGVRGVIGHTQPRRIAARTVAERIAEELEVPLGGAIGYTVRFTDRASEDTLVRVMTDGILLAEIQRDRDLSRYDTIILDEAHERSLNIDFLLGYLTGLLARRPDLKLIITSATIDPERFAQHFGNAPIIEVSGRSYPVEVRYRPLVDPDDENAEERDPIEAICAAVEELQAEAPGDVLVFLSGEREIRDTAEALRASTHGDRHEVEVLPLYARLSSAEQHRVFEPHHGRRIVLATNVAETSLTVPGIRYVVDPGTARISRYSHRTKVQRLPIERISRASADQRKGRCGRTSDGICIRLYTEEDYLSRTAFTDPEILRTHLASVILAMTALGLGDMADFPFLDPPDRRSIRDGIALLEELGAIERTGELRLTPIGRSLAQLPLDPRLARMVLEADRNGCVHEVMVITAALSIQDPRERPVERAAAAAQLHSRFAHEDSDFLSYLNLWNYLQAKQTELSGSQFRKLCKAEFLHFLRVREWQDLVSQLRQVCRPMGITPGTQPGNPTAIAQSLLAGLLSHIGMKDVEKQDYLGARGARFAIFPGSVLARKRPRWVMAGELVETSRLWGRVAAKIEPEWAEALAPHLVKRTYSEPHWEKNRGAVVALEKVTLYGIPLAAGRKVSYGSIDPALARELFIRHALVEGDWRTHHAFFAQNRELLEDVLDLEHKVRRRDIVVEDEALFDFYDQRIGPDVVSGRHFDSWWKKARREDPELLNFERAMLVNAQADQIDERDYPDHWQVGEISLPLTYQFEPGTQADGVTATIPVQVLNRLGAARFDWQVPGLRPELATALIRSLPKGLRRSVVPAPDHAAAVLRRVSPEDGPLTEVLARELRAMTGVLIPADAWDLRRVPEHLRMTFRIVGPDGRVLAEGKDLDALGSAVGADMRQVISAAAPEIEQEGLRAWTIGDLPRSFSRPRAGMPVQGYPALVDEGDSVAVRVLATAAEQDRAMLAGTRRLLLLRLPSPMRTASARLSSADTLVLVRNPHGSVKALFDDVAAAAVDALVERHGGPAWTAADYARLETAVGADLEAMAEQILALTAKVLAAAHDVERALRGQTSLTLLPALTDIREQLASLLPARFVTEHGAGRLPDLVRYLRAAHYRLERLPDDPARDRQRQTQVQALTQDYERWRSALPPRRRAEPEVSAIRWMLEELRVSLFAQPLKTAYPVSPERIAKAMAQLAG